MTTTTCRKCRGSGEIRKGYKSCGGCGGSGGGGFYGRCIACGGSGSSNIPNMQRCGSCNGKGVIGTSGGQPPVRKEASNFGVMFFAPFIVLKIGADLIERFAFLPDPLIGIVAFVAAILSIKHWKWAWASGIAYLLLVGILS